MAKFLNKKEQVFDLKLTTYGRQMLSVGSLKPTYYAFYDDGVIYDLKYSHRPDALADAFVEVQNNIHNRIKNETQYLESLTLFESVEQTLGEGIGVVNFFDLDDLETKKITRKNVFKFDSAIGDAHLDGETNVAPAWKIVTLQSKISASSPKDETDYNEINIPQIDIEAYYNKKIERVRFNPDPRDVREINLVTNSFVDNRVIKLEQTDPLIYIEEINTEILTDNFDIEVFEVITDQGLKPGYIDVYKRKYFEKHIPQIVDGIMVSPTRIKNPEQELTTDDVEYYFDILIDHQIDQSLACKGAEIFNKQSYYVNLDFDCEEQEQDLQYYDIYGTELEPPICQS